jgi:hypothetical protein
MIRTILMAVGTAVCVALAVACGGGDDGGNRGGAADDTAGEITSDQLSRMVLAIEDFGPEFGNFSPDQKNGLQNVETASEPDFDAVGERADLETAGFASGYRNLYQRQATSGVFFAGSGATLFATKEGAGNYVSDSRKELTEYLGKTIGDLTIKSSSPFDVGVADEAVGANQDIDIKSSDGSTVTVWYTAVLFRRGRLSGVVAISAIGPSESEQRRLQGKVEALASTMNERMGSALAGSAPAAVVP